MREKATKFSVGSEALLRLVSKAKSSILLSTICLQRLNLQSCCLLYMPSNAKSSILLSTIICLRRPLVDSRATTCSKPVDEREGNK